MNTKKCKECLKEIDENASKCPYCQAYQRPFDRGLRSPFITLALIPIFLIYFSFVVGRDDPIYDGEKYLQIKNTNFQFFTSECGQQVALIGTIENISDKAIGNVVLNVEYYSADGKVIDVANDEQYELIIPPGTSKSFKVSSKTSADNSQYASSKVTISKLKFDRW